METTLRTDVTFEQARAARRSGFETILFFVGLSPMREAIRRIKIRADAGGHAAPEKTLRDIYRASIGNLPAAVRYFEHVFVFDNSTFNASPRLVLEAQTGQTRRGPGKLPQWVLRCLSRVSSSSGSRLPWLRAGHRGL